MLKLMHKKLNKKGFTLAELLVVIAILAILIAIAVPVFTHMVAEANLRVNQANVHSVRSAAVAHILTHLGEPDDTAPAGSGPLLNAYIGEKGARWVATAKVDNNGNISDLLVYALKSTEYSSADNKVVEGISINNTSGRIFYTTESKDFYQISDKVESDFATVKPSMGNVKLTDGTAVYTVQAVITDLKED